METTTEVETEEVGAGVTGTTEEVEVTEAPEVDMAAVEEAVVEVISKNLQAIRVRDLLTLEDRILNAVAEDEPSEFYYLNIFNLPQDIDDKEILDYYKAVKISKIHRPNRDAADLEFDSKDLLIKAIDIGTGTLRGQPFYMRSSYYNSRNAARRGGMRGGRGGGGRGGGRYGGRGGNG